MHRRWPDCASEYYIVFHKRGVGGKASELAVLLSRLLVSMEPVLRLGSEGKAGTLTEWLNSPVYSRLVTLLDLGIEASCLFFSMDHIYIESTRPLELPPVIYIAEPQDCRIRS